MAKHSKATINRVLTLRLSQGWTYPQIAKELGISRSSAIGIVQRHRDPTEWGQPSKPKAYCQ